MFAILYIVDLLFCVPVLILGLSETVWAVAFCFIVSFMSRANERRTVVQEADRHASLLTSVAMLFLGGIVAFLVGEAIIVLPAFLVAVFKYLLPARIVLKMTKQAQEKINPEEISDKAFRRKQSGISKRILDIIAGSCLLVILSPILLFSVLLVILHSGKPAIIKQERVGKGGKPFMMFKLRTFSRQNGSHAVNSVGKLLRPLRIDEIPQLLNVLRGEMSIVGPRPELPDFHEMGINCVPDYELRLLVNPGLTGWAQINYKYTTTPEEYLEKTLYDLFYVKNRTLLMDLKCMAKTPHALAKALLTKKE